MKITINGTISEVMEFFSQFQGTERNAGVGEAKSETPPAMTSDHVATIEDFKRPFDERINPNLRGIVTDSET